jgi:xylulokinase
MAQAESGEPTMSAYLGIDVGTSGTKTVICREDGTILATATAEHPSYYPQPGWSEQEPEDWWKSTVQSVRQALSRAGIPGTEIRGIGLSGQMHGSVFLDEKGQVLRRAILWNDQRTAEQCRQIEEAAGGRANLIRMVGNPAFTGFTAPKILWLRQHEPHLYETHSQNSFAERLHPLPAHRRIRYGSQRRFGDTIAGCSRATMVQAVTGSTANSGGVAAGVR